MSDQEPFVRRWSRLKDETAKKKVDAARSGPGKPAAGGAADTLAKADKPSEPAFDPATLPPIESITAVSDIRAFLQSGVPAELTKAALRRVWATDPAIRDFIGIAENQWDFTDPTAMPGFGPLEASDDVQELVAQAMGKLRQTSEQRVAAVNPAVSDGPSAISSVGEAPSSQALGIPERIEEIEATRGSVEEHPGQDFVAPQHVDVPAEDGITLNRRTHGSALPQ